MFTKKTRALSALLTVCMLISMLACFVVPASAAVYTPYVEGELYSATGLTDVSALDDIKDGLKTDVTAYKVTNRAGFLKLDELVEGGNTFDGYTFTMANDIDMEWKNFNGVGRSDKTFSGTFDGNGFVIENLMIAMPYVAQMGLFNNVTAATIKNVGIASGLVFGFNVVGALVGRGNSTADALTKVYNCWNAATVVSAEGDSGGLVGVISSSSNQAVGSPIYNSYNLGLVYLGTYGGGLFGTAYNNYVMSVKNSYNYGTLVGNASSTAQMKYAGFGRSRLDKNNIFPDTANNAYVTNELGFKSAYEAILAGDATPKSDDQAKEYAKADFTGTDILNRLNTEMATVANPAGYTVKYDAVAGVGYPVLTYYKDGAPVVRRVAHTAENVGENTWATQNKLFGDFCANLNKTGDALPALGRVEIKDNTDLFALGLVMLGNAKVDDQNKWTGLGITEVSFTQDIDASIAPAFLANKGNANFVIPIAMGSISGTGAGNNSPVITVNGNGHVIKNWHNYVASGSSVDLVGALFAKVGNGFKINDLGMEDVLVEYAEFVPQSTSYHSRYGVMVGKIGASCTIALNNCWADGKIIVHKVTGNTSYAVKSFGGLVAWDQAGKSTAKNCWVDLDVENATYPSYTKAPVWGHNGKAENMTNVYCVATESDVVISDYASLCTKVDASTAGEVAYKLNQLGLKDSANSATYYKLNANKTSATWATQATAIYKLTIQQKYDAEGEENDVVLSETDYYYNAGETVTVPSFNNYTVVASTVPAGNKMPAADHTIVYTADAFDWVPAETINDELKNVNPGYFAIEYANALTEAQNAVAALLDTKGDATVLDPARYELMDTLNAKVDALNALDAEAALLINSTAITKENYTTIIPNYSEFETYKALNPGNIWGVDSKEDWLALVDADTAVSTSVDGAAANYDIYLKGDIDMGSAPMSPLAHSGSFRGSLNGMGHKFKNIYVTDTESETKREFVGLISSMYGGGYVNNLGIESGVVEVTNTVDGKDGGFGVVVGYNSDGEHYKVWVGEDVTLVINDATSTGSANDSYGTYVGRGNGSFDSCYTYAKISVTGFDLDHCSAFVDYQSVGNHPVRTFNCFGVMDENSTIANRYVTRYAASGTNTKFMTVNTWGVNVKDITNKAELNEENAGYNLEQGAVASGELAYKLNTNWQNFNTYKDKGNVSASQKGQLPDYERVYWTVANGKTIIGTAENQTRRITVNANGDELYFYASKDEKVDMAAVFGENVTFADNTAVWDGKSVVMGDADITLTVTSMNETAKNKALALFDGKDLSETSDFVDAAAITAAINKLNATQYTDQAVLNADVKALTDLYKLNAEKAYNVRHPYNVEAFVIGPDMEFAGYTLEADPAIKSLHIGSVEDLEYVEKNVDLYTLEHTLYLDADLDLAESEFVSLNGLKASFDGQNYKITNYNRKNMANTAFFDVFYGKSLKNLTFEDCDVSGQYSALIMYRYNGEGTLALENITVNNCAMAYTGGNQLSPVLSITGQSGDVAMKNITVTNNVITGVNGNSNFGMLTTNMNNGNTVTAENILITGNTTHNVVKSNISGSSWVFGALEGNTENNVTLKNARIYNNHSTFDEPVDPEDPEAGTQQAASALPGLIAGEVFSKNGVAHKLNVENVLAYDNDSRSIYTRRHNDTYTTGVLTATNLVTDTDKIYDFATEEFKEVSEYVTAGVTVGESESAAGKLAMAYAYNKGTQADKVAVTVQNVFVDVDENNKAPLKVSIMKDTEEAAAFYTYADGSFAGDEDLYSHLAECMFTDASGAKVEVDEIGLGVTEDTVYYALDHKYGDPVPSAGNNAQTHTHVQECLNGCGKADIVADCTDEDGAEHKIASETVAGGDYYKCDDCGYEWVENYVGKLRVLRTNEIAATMVGDPVIIELTLSNSTDLTDLTVKVEYDADALEYVSNTLDGATVNTSTEGVLILTVDKATPIRVVNNLLAKITFNVKNTAEDQKVYDVKVTVSGAKAGETDVTVTDAVKTIPVKVVNSNKGDLDGDGNMTVNDVHVMLEHFAKGTENDLSVDQKAIADLDSNGSFNIIDVLVALKKLASGV